jgi:hypothetical protein
MEPSFFDSSVHVEEEQSRDVREEKNDPKLDNTHHAHPERIEEKIIEYPDFTDDDLL